MTGIYDIAYLQVDFDAHVLFETGVSMEKRLNDVSDT